MKEHWTKEMKQKLEGHRMAPPEGLWEGIGQQLSTSSPKKKASIKPLYWAAAAALMALVGFFAYDRHNSSAPVQLAEQAAQPAAHETVSSDAPAAEAHVNVVAPSATSTQLASVSVPAAATPAAEVSETSTDTFTDGDLPAVASTATTEAPPASEESKSSTAPATPRHEKATYTAPLPKPRTKGARWSVGINTAGGLLADNSSVRTERIYTQTAMQFKNTSQYDYITPPPGYKASLYSLYYEEYTYSNIESVSKHHFPLRLGLNVQYQLNRRIAVNGGLGYTLLRSEFSIPLYPNISYKQELHYIDLPIGISWQLWTTKHFSLYLAGGAMLEKCLRLDPGIERPSKPKKPWQWSVNTSAGAEYKLISQLGLYLEPSLGYYFDDGTSLEHYYKEHPLAPAIAFGLRLHLKE